MWPKPCSTAVLRRIDLPDSKTSPPPCGIALVLAALAALGPFSIDTYMPSFHDLGASLHASPLAVQFSPLSSRQLAHV